MVLSFTRLSWLWLTRKCGLGFRGEPGILNDGYDDDDDDDENRVPSSNPNRIKAKKRKWKSRNEGVMSGKDHEDSILVPSDGMSLSGSESDWSIGWLEPHAPNFNSDDSFAVLVPCYRREGLDIVERGGNRNNSTGGYSEGSRECMERWLSSLQKY